MLQHTAAPLHQFGKNMIRDSRWRVQGEQALRAREAAPHEIEAARRMQEMRDLMELRRARESENPEETGAYAGMRFTSGLSDEVYYHNQTPLHEPTNFYNGGDGGECGYYDYDLQDEGAQADYGGLLHTTSGHSSSSPHNVHFMGSRGWRTKRC